MPVLSHLTSLKPVLLLNRNGCSIAFSMPSPSHFDLKPALLLNRVLFNPNGCYVAFRMPVPSCLTSLQPELLLNRGSLTGTLAVTPL